VTIQPSARIARTKGLSAGPSQSRGARRRPQLLAPPGPMVQWGQPITRDATRDRAPRSPGQPAATGATRRRAHRTSAGSALAAVWTRFPGGVKQISRADFKMPRGFRRMAGAPGPGSARLEAGQIRAALEMGHPAPPHPGAALAPAGTGRSVGRPR